MYFDKALEITDICTKFKYLIYTKYAQFYDKYKNLNFTIKYKELALMLKPQNLDLVASLVTDYIANKRIMNAIQVYK